MVADKPTPTYIYYTGVGSIKGGKHSRAQFINIMHLNFKDTKDKTFEELLAFSGASIKKDKVSTKK